MNPVEIMQAASIAAEILKNENPNQNTSFTIPQVLIHELLNPGELVDSALELDETTCKNLDEAFANPFFVLWFYIKVEETTYEYRAIPMLHREASEGGNNVQATVGIGATMLILSGHFVHTAGIHSPYRKWEVSFQFPE